MNPKINMKGFIPILAAVGIGIISAVIGAVIVLETPFSFFEKFSTLNFGTTVTDISTATKFADFPAIYNTNNSALNLGKIEVSTTTLPLITTLNGLTSASSLATVGTITTGTWNATALTVSKGGTGTTSPSLWQVILGNGANGLTVASSTGSSGQFLTSNGAGAYPSWQSATVNQGDNYNWTGTHTFTATKLIPSLSQGWLSVNSVTGAITSSTSPTVNYITATSTAATSTFYNLSASNNATTTNLFVSGTQTGGTMSYTGSSTDYSVSSGTVTYTGSIPTTANFGIGTYFIDTTSYDWKGNVTISRTGVTATNIAHGTVSGNPEYSFTWSGSNLVVAEVTDLTSSVTGTIYWYR